MVEGVWDLVTTFTFPGIERGLARLGLNLRRLGTCERYPGFAGPVGRGIRSGWKILDRPGTVLNEIRFLETGIAYGAPGSSGRHKRAAVCAEEDRVDIARRIPLCVIAGRRSTDDRFLRRNFSRRADFPGGEVGIEVRAAPHAYRGTLRNHPVTYGTKCLDRRAAHRPLRTRRKGP